MSNREELQGLLNIARSVLQLQKDRDDLLIGVVAGLVDLYRALFSREVDSKAEALARLRIQHQQLAKAVPPVDCLSLRWLIETLEEDKLDAAKLLRVPPAGAA